MFIKLKLLELTEYEAEVYIELHVVLRIKVVSTSQELVCIYVNT
jgi:sugar-specific transcriptional regulator TrmB